MSATAGDQLARLELLLGDCCPLPVASGRLIELSLSAEALAKLTKYWLALPAGSRPRLRGLAVLGNQDGGGGEKQIQFIVDIGGRSPLVLFGAPLAKGHELQRFSAIWPYAGWWEEENRFFEGVRVASGGAGSGVAWQQS